MIHTIPFCEQLIQHLADSIECSQLDDGTDRIGCATPLEYPDGDGIVVWIAPHHQQGVLEVSDFSEGDTKLAAAGPSLKGAAATAQAICSELDVTYTRGRVWARAALSDAPDVIWRVAMASSRIAEGRRYHRPKVEKEGDFGQLVVDTLREYNLPVDIHAELEGKSGRTYEPTIYLPATHTVLEPLTGEQMLNQARSVYVEFGDLSRANGYRLMAIIDDRLGPASEEVPRLMSQVADVADWSRHEMWLPELS